MPDFLIKKCSFVLFLLTVVLTPMGALAQDNQGIVDPFAFRSPTSYGSRDTNIDPFAYRGEPVQFGSFLLWPNITLEKEYNDNIFATENNEDGDFVNIIKPELIVRKNIRRHEFILALNTELRRNWDTSSENVENYRAKFEANIEAKQGIDIPIEISYRDGHLKRRDQTRANAADLSVNPLRNKALDVESGIIYKPHRLLLSLLGNYRQGRLINGKLANGTAVVRDNRDINITKGTLRAGYDISPTLSPYIELSYTQENYINEAAGAMTRNNNLYRGLAGLSFDYRGLLTGSIGAGYENRNFDSASVDDADSLSIDGNIMWQPRAKTQLDLELSQGTFEDNIIIAGLEKSFAQLSLKHELYRDVFLRSNLSYELKDFNNITREDKTYEAGIGVLYIINPHFQIGADYKFINRNSNVSGLSLDNNIIMLRARAAL